jgi:PAS domain S-box-containing protein
MYWDFFIFAALIIIAHWREERARGAMLRRAVREVGCELPAGALGRFLPAAVGATLVGLLIGGWLFAENREHYTRQMMEQAGKGSGLLMARELERMGHASVPGYASADNNRALASAAAEWLGTDPRIVNIFTVRKSADGTNIVVLAVGSGQGAAGRRGVDQPVVRPGEDYTAHIPELEAAFQGRPTLQGSPAWDRHDFAIRLFVPLRDADGKIEAVLGIAYNAVGWQTAIMLERAGAMGVTFLLALMLNSLYWMITRRRIDAVYAKQRAEQLLESETRFRNFADNAPVLLQMTDSEGNAVFFNRTWLEFTGQALAAPNGRAWLDTVHPEDRPALVAGQAAAFASREVFRHEFRLRHICGRYRWMVAVYMPRWQGNRFAGYIGSCTDITAHRQLEQTLRRQVELEKLLAAVSARFVNIAPEALDAAIREALAEICRFTGADRAHILLFDDDFTAPRQAYNWHAAGIAGMADDPPVVPFAAGSWLQKEMAAKGRINIPHTAAIPVVAERETLLAAGIKSLAALPLTVGDHRQGFLGLHALRAERTWREEDLTLSRLLGEVILGAIQRCQAVTALAKSEAENKAILASVPDFLCRVNAAGIILDIKPSYRQGGAAPSLVGGSIARFLPAHLVQPALDAIARTLASGEMNVFEYYLKMDSATTYCEARVTKAGEHDALIIVRDITDRRRSEACDLLLLDIAVKVLEEQPLEDILTFACRHIAGIFGVSLLWVARKENDGTIRTYAASEQAKECVRQGDIRWNAGEAAQGPTGTAIRTGKFQLVGIDDKSIRPWRERFVKHGVTGGAAFPLKVGGLILGALTVYATDQSFWTRRSIVHLTNFAEQIALAIHSTTSRQRLKLLTTGLESTATAVVITDRSGVIQWVNPAFLQLTGHKVAAVLAKNIRAVFSGKEAATFYRNISQNILTGRAWQGELTGRRRDGGLYTAEITVTPVRDENGEIANFIAIVHDVTQRRQAEQEMLEAREAVARAERLSSLGIMAAGIAHEINQPLNSLKVAADGMLYWHRQGKTPTLAKIMENIEKISQQADRIDNIIKHMRIFVTSNQCGRPEPCDINTAVVEALSLTGAQLAAHGIAVRPSLAPGLPPVLAGATQLEEVIINLIVNAMQSLDTVDRPGKCITILSGMHKNEVFLEIGDNGAGINSKIKGKIFEPFFTTKPAGEGMGLGLSIVHSIVASYGGHILAKTPAEGPGAAFRITLPTHAEKEKGEKQA